MKKQILLAMIALSSIFIASTSFALSFKNALLNGGATHETATIVIPTDIDTPTSPTAPILTLSTIVPTDRSILVDHITVHASTDCASTIPVLYDIPGSPTGPLPVIDESFVLDGMQLINLIGPGLACVQLDVTVAGEDNTIYSTGPIALTWSDTAGYYLSAKPNTAVLDFTGGDRDTGQIITKG